MKPSNIYIVPAVLKPLKELDSDWLGRLRERLNEYFVGQMRFDPDGQQDWYKRYRINTGYRIWIAWRGNKRIGSIGLTMVNEDHAEIGPVMIVPELWGEGIGTYIVNEVMKMSAKEGTQDFFIRVLATNWRARKVYDRMGFVDLAYDLVPQAQYDLKVWWMHRRYEYHE
jgi:RimJ/RimL family protein N-acetyltransferase